MEINLNDKKKNRKCIVLNENGNEGKRKVELTVRKTPENVENLQHEK